MATTDEFIMFGGTGKFPVLVPEIALSNNRTQKIIQACRHVHVMETGECIHIIPEFTCLVV